MQNKNETTSYHTLPNGLRIVHRQTASPVVWVGLMAGAGTRDELAEENGLAHYIEHCVFKGTEHRSARQIINRIEGIGGEINAYTTKEETTFYAAVPAAYTGRAIELIADMVYHPLFEKEETDKELQVILDEIESYNDSPSELIYDDFEGLVFSGHPLQMPILGTRRTLRRITAGRAHRFMQTCYNPEHTVLFSQSPLPMSRIRAYAERWLGTIPYNARAYSRTAPSAEPARRAEYRRHTHQTHVMLGGRADPIGHPKQPAFYLLNNILGGGSLNSRLNLSLREQRGLVYTIESTYTPMSDTGYWSVYFACEPQHEEQCKALVMRELQRLRREPLSRSAMQQALRQLQGQMAIAAENRENNALGMAKLMLYGNEAPTWQQTFSEIERLTPTDLADCANELLAEEGISGLWYR